MLSKFLNTKTLIILLVIFGVIYLVTKLTEKEDRTFKSELVVIDTSDVTLIKIIPKIGGGDEIIFTKTGFEWKVESAWKSYKPDKSSLNNLLTELTKMRTERVAATDQSKWKEFEVTDSTGSRIQLFNGKKIISDLYIGKFSYSQAQGQQNPYQKSQPKMYSHIRPAGEDEVYVVEGFVKMTIQPNINAYRDKNLCVANKDDFTRLTFDYPGIDNFTLSKEENRWFLNGQPADSAKTAKYLQKIAKVTSSNFIDDVEPLISSPSHILKVEGNNILPVEIRAFPADSVNKYVVTSSLVPDTKYSGEKGRLFERVFAGRNEFLPDQPEQDSSSPSKK